MNAVRATAVSDNAIQVFLAGVAAAGRADHLFTMSYANNQNRSSKFVTAISIIN